MKQPAKASLLCVLMAGALSCAAASAGEATAAAAPAAATSAAAAADDGAAQAIAPELKTLDGMLSALYGTISGAAGAPRDWERLRSLFAPEGRMVVHGVNKSGEITTRVLTVSDYISRVTPVFAKEGFYETELARTTEAFGQIAHIFSTYESRHAPDEAKPFQRGMNSIQLVNDGQRWWIQSLVWQAETDKNPLPERYLKGKH
ncbi:hypothetical protein [Pseudoduganella aquatica]|uniref:hypothetical protein n=1 Tax=Pseudoduganella aquatica TaxID=2660641 RepID=UPI001E2AE844|nr:hypothetical protein [Pseudoduganella aquatica]